MHAGVTVSFDSSSSTFEESLRSLNSQLTNSTGMLKTQAQSIGGYLTRYLPDGSYFDAVGQLTHYRNIYNHNASQDGFGADMLGEVGKSFAPAWSHIAIELEVQLLYQYLHLNPLSDAVSLVSGTTTNALRGRIGLRISDANLQTTRRRAQRLRMLNRPRNVGHVDVSAAYMHLFD